jgi:hypothetical protein
LRIPTATTVAAVVVVVLVPVLFATTRRWRCSKTDGLGHFDVISSSK